LLASSTPASEPLPPSPEESALDALEGAARHDFKDFLVMLLRLVPYSEFAPRMPEPRYRKLLLLACMDLLSELDEKEKFRRLGNAEPEPLRQTPDAIAVRERVAAAALKLSEERDTATTARDFEPVFAREKMRLALSGPIDARASAVDAFLDRRSARKGREDGSAGMVLPAALLEALKAGFQLGAAAADEEISARRLNTPKLVGQGETV
jgi:hypothetical protein